MLNDLITWDQWLLLVINSAHCAFADTLMWIISGKLTWIWLYVLLLGLVFYRCHQLSKTHSLRLPWWLIAILTVVVVAGSAGLADFVSSGIIKHAVCRWRPTHDPGLMALVHRVNGYAGGNYGFVSSHAADTFACALSFALFWHYTSDHKKRATLGVTLPLMIWVVLNCYSRVYLGVHYPGDIVGGLCVGGAIAVLLFLGLRTVLPVVDDEVRAGTDDSCKRRTAP